MAQSTLHFSFGMLIGMLATFPPLWRGWQQGRPVSRLVARGGLVAYGIGLYAVMPAVISRLTGDSQMGTGIGWNLFLFYPLLDRLELPGIFRGELAVGGLFVIQYTVILLAIRRARRLAAGKGA